MDVTKDVFIILLVVIVITIIIQTAPNFQTGVLRVSVIMYTLILYRTVCKIRDDKNGKNDKKSDDTASPAVSHIANIISAIPNDLDDMDLSIDVDDITDIDSNIDASEDENTRRDAESEDMANKEKIRDALHQGVATPPDGKIYNTAQGRYTSCHKPPSYVADQCQLYDGTTFDEENTRQQRERNRTKRSIDGMVSKTADYYKIHYANEFDKEEAKNGWWGDYNYGITQY